MSEKIYTVQELAPIISEYSDLLGRARYLNGINDAGSMTAYDVTVTQPELERDVKSFKEKCDKNLFDNCFKKSLARILGE